ncbi:unnamed protein product [Colias eurytheme]|nr:unnamed protein product [Colias eurytheme]
MKYDSIARLVKQWLVRDKRRHVSGAEWSSRAARRRAAVPRCACFQCREFTVPKRPYASSRVRIGNSFIDLSEMSPETMSLAPGATAAAPGE